jgi:hypothetical protein
MTSYKILAALALLSATASTSVFSTTLKRQVAQNFVSSRARRASWQLFLVPPQLFCGRDRFVLIPIERNVPKQQQKGLANVSPTLFGECMRGMARPSYLRGVASVDDVGRMECHVFAV